MCVARVLVAVLLRKLVRSIATGYGAFAGCLLERAFSGN